MENLCATAWTYHHTRRVAMHSKTYFPNWLISRIEFGSASVLEPSGIGFVFTQTFSEGSQLIPKYHLRKLCFHFLYPCTKVIFCHLTPWGKFKRHMVQVCARQYFPKPRQLDRHRTRGNKPSSASTDTIHSLVS